MQILVQTEREKPVSAEPQLFRINPENRESEKIEEIDFTRLGFQERRDIQEWVAANPSILGDDLLIIGKEFSGFDRTNERLDLLAVDQDGKLVIIELKRDHTGADAHWQAIKYASYIHRARYEDIIRMFAEYEGVSETEAADRLLQHLGADDLNGLNKDQRIILASHRFAPEVTSASLWLNQKTPDEDLITCVQLVPYHDSQTNSLYIQANTIIPMPGAEEYSVGIGDSLSEDDGGHGSSLGSKLRRTFQRNRNDEVTPFLRRVASLTVDELPEETKPDRTSRWGVGRPDHRYYRLWYSRQPWLNRRMYYQIDIYQEDPSNPSQWRGEVGFGYDKHKLGELNYSEDDYPILENMIQGLGTHTSLGDFSGERRRKTIVAFDNSSPLDDSFAKTLSDNLRPIIESVTPAIDDLEEERISQHYAP